jgi:hypothetical protein
MDNNFLLEEYNAKTGFLPVDMNTAAITGARVSLAKNGKCVFVVSMGTSTAAVVQFTLKQHNAASAGTSKVLEVANKYFVKAGAATVFTQTEPTVAASLFDLSVDFAANGGVAVFEVNAEDLDVEGDFGYVSLDVADSTAAKLGSCIYILRDCVYQPGYSVAV